MNKYIVLLLILLSTKLMGQDVAINLSIEWNHEEKFNIDELRRSPCPFLRISYHNLTDDSIYMHKVYWQDKNIPVLPPGGFSVAYKYQDLKNIKVANIKRNVYIGSRLPNDFWWDVLSDSIDPYSEYEIPLINETYNDIYRLLYGPIVSGKRLNTDSLYEVTEDLVINEMKEKYVFLSRGSTYQESFNLLPFKIVGGHYSFMLLKEELDNFLYANPTWNKEKEIWEFSKVELPLMVNGFKLYDGEFYTNSVTVDF